MIKYFTILFVPLLICCGGVEQNQKIQETQDLEYIFEFGIIDYDSSDAYDTKLGINDFEMLIMNYGLAHSDFVASSASIKTFKNLKEDVEFTAGVEETNAKYKHLRDSLELKDVSIVKLLDKKNLKLNEDFQIKLDYDLKGQTTISITNARNEDVHLISEEIFPSSPSFNLIDLNGDDKKELIIFFPSIDYWESESFVCKVYDLSRYY